MKMLCLCLLVISFATPVSLGAEPTPGSIVEVTCKADSGQRYSCYLPSGYDAEKTWPILYCFSPNAHGDAFTQRYRAVCEERGWIVVGSMNSRNGPMAPIQVAIDAMWADCEARFNLKKTMRYVTGFSGGARVSFHVAQAKADRIAGVIAIGAGLHTSASAPAKGLAVALMCGETDPNKRELDPLFKRLKTAGNPVTYENFPGGHIMPEIALLTKAVEWLDDLSSERRIERFEAALASAEGLETEGKPVEAWIAVVEALAKYPELKAQVKRAEKLRKHLEKEGEVKPEVAARKKLANALAWIEKNTNRIAKSKSVRAQAKKRLTDVIERYPDSRAAEQAKPHLARLTGD